MSSVVYTLIGEDEFTAEFIDTVVSLLPKPDYRETIGPEVGGLRIEAWFGSEGAVLVREWDGVNPDALLLIRGGQEGLLAYIEELRKEAEELRDP